MSRNPCTTCLTGRKWILLLHDNLKRGFLSKQTVGFEWMSPGCATCSSFSPGQKILPAIPGRTHKLYSKIFPASGELECNPHAVESWRKRQIQDKMQSLVSLCQLLSRAALFSAFRKSPNIHVPPHFVSCCFSQLKGNETRDIFVVDDGRKRLSFTLILITQILFHTWLKRMTWITSEWGRVPLISCLYHFSVLSLLKTLASNI